MANQSLLFLFFLYPGDLYSAGVGGVLLFLKKLIRYMEAIIIISFLVFCLVLLGAFVNIVWVAIGFEKSLKKRIQQYPQVGIPGFNYDNRTSKQIDLDRKQRVIV